jgi:hypothetical protein
MPQRTDSQRQPLLQAEGRITRALRQEARMQEGHAAEDAERKRLGPIRGRAPESLEVLGRDFEDERYFFLVSARQAVSSRQLLVDLGFTVPAIRREDALIAWRDILEHWDDDARGVPVRAKKKWTQSGVSGDPGSHWVYTPDDGIKEMNGISLVELKEDLSALLDAVKALEEVAFNADWPTREQAAAFIHMDLEKFDRLAPWGVARMDWSRRGAGIRYQQSDLDKWKAQLIAQDDWPPALQPADDPGS